MTLHENTSEEHEKARLYALDITNVVWERSSVTVPGAQVEIAKLPEGGMAMRDSSNPDTVLRFNAAEWKAFVLGARDGEFDIRPHYTYSVVEDGGAWNIRIHGLPPNYHGITFTYNEEKVETTARNCVAALLDVPLDSFDLTIAKPTIKARITTSDATGSWIIAIEGFTDGRSLAANIPIDSGIDIAKTVHNLVTGLSGVPASEFDVVMALDQKDMNFAPATIPGTNA